MNKSTNHSFYLKQTDNTHNHRIAIFDDNREFIGLLIASFRNESANAFGYNYGQIYQRTSFCNIDNFPELKESKYFAIEYVSAQEKAIFTKIKLAEIKKDKTPENKIINKLNKVYLENRQMGNNMNSFFEISLDESQLIIRSGRVNSKGIRRIIRFSREEKAEKAFQQKIEQKLQQGFIICTQT